MKRMFAIGPAVSFGLLMLAARAAFPGGETKPEAGEATPAPAVTPWPWRLGGVSLSSENGRDTAFIFSDGRQGRYRVGDKIGDATVREIRANEVVLDRGGRPITLSMAGGRSDRPAAEGKSGGTIKVDFDNLDIRAVIRYFSDLTGKNFILDSNVRGTVTLIAPTPIRIDDALNLLASLLEMQGLALVPSGDFIKVMPKREAAERAIPLVTGEAEPAGSGSDFLITRVVPLRYGNAETIFHWIARLLPRDSAVFPDASSNSLIITDSQSNVERLMKLIQERDRPGPSIDLRDFIKTVSDKTGRNFILSPEVRGSITMFVPTKIEDADDLATLEKVLETCGYKMEPAGAFTRVVPDPARRPGPSSQEPQISRRKIQRRQDEAASGGKTQEE